MKKTIDRFTLLEPLAAGGTGTVFHAEETLPGNTRRPVALKVLPVFGPREKAQQDRFFGEIQAIVRLANHPNIITVYGIGISPEGVPWIAMEYVPTTLTSLIGDNPAPIPDVIDLLEQIGTALAAMAAQEPPLIHHDLKPANILRDAFNRYRLTDFALASVGALERTRVLATVRYAAPEVMSREFGQISPATDLYALGHIAYEFALGGRMYRQQFANVFDQAGPGKDAPPARWMAWHCSLESPAAPLNALRPDVPSALSEIIARLMAKELDRRYARATDLLNDLRPFRTGAPAPTTAPAPSILPARAGAPAASSFRGTFPPATTPRTTPSDPSVNTSPPPAATPRFATSPAPVAEGPVYFVRFRTTTTGPFDIPTLQRRFKQGLLSRLHQISTDQQQWTSVDQALQNGMIGQT